MDGGNAQQGCGYNAWLYSCCMQNSATTVRKRNPTYSHLSQLKRHDDLQNSFSRRRYDSSENQLVPACGIPRTPSSTLQRRIIGGRAAHFAEFPWQSHIRIKEYQCGGGKSCHQIEWAGVLGRIKDNFCWKDYKTNQLLQKIFLDVPWKVLFLNSSKKLENISFLESFLPLPFNG